MDYKSTLNLPKTDFAMQAGLPKREPVMLEKWYEDKVYETVLEKNDGKPLYVLHDGPPYANGDIHLGTALNKTLKDFIVRYKNMSGFKAPYVPGWDTHGLPTELKARKKAGVSNSTQSPTSSCASSAASLPSATSMSSATPLSVLAASVNGTTRMSPCARNLKQSRSRSSPKWRRRASSIRA